VPLQPNSAVCTAAATVQLRHCVEEAEPSAAGLDCQLNEPAAARLAPSQARAAGMHAAGEPRRGRGRSRRRLSPLSGDSRDGSRWFYAGAAGDSRPYVGNPCLDPRRGSRLNGSQGSFGAAGPARREPPQDPKSYNVDGRIPPATPASGAASGRREPSTPLLSAKPLLYQCFLTLTLARRHAWRAAAAASRTLPRRLLCRTPPWRCQRRGHPSQHHSKR